MNEMKKTQETPKVSKYTLAILILLISALVISSFTNSSFSLFHPTMIHIGPRKINWPHFMNLWRKECALTALGGNSKDDHPSLVLERIVGGQLQELEASRVGLDVSQAAAKRALTENPLFIDGGVFSQEKFQKFLQNYEISRRDLVEAQRLHMVRQLYLEALLSQIYAPKILKALVRQGRGQVRSGYYRVFPISLVTSIQPPNEKELRELFRKDPVRAPEFRTFSVLCAKVEPSSSQEGSGDDMENTLSRVEALLDEGRSFAAIASSAQIPVWRVTVDEAGKTQGGETAQMNVPQEALLQIVAKAFSMSAAQDTAMIQTGAGEFAWIRLETIKPPHTLTYEEANGLKIPETLYFAKKRQEALEKIASSFALDLARYGKGSLASMVRVPFVAENNTSHPEASAPHSGPNMEMVTKALFSLEPQGVTTLWNKEKTALYVIKLSEIAYTPKDDPELDSTTQGYFAQSLLDAYQRGLENVYEITTHEKFSQHIKNNLL